MIRLSPGVRVTRRDGRQMIIRHVTQDGDMRVVRWAESGRSERTFLAAISPSPARSNETSHTTNGHPA